MRHVLLLEVGHVSTLLYFCETCGHFFWTGCDRVLLAAHPLQDPSEGRLWHKVAKVRSSAVAQPMSERPRSLELERIGKSKARTRTEGVYLHATADGANEQVEGAANKQTTKNGRN